MISSHPHSDEPQTDPGLEPAITVPADQPAGAVLAALREAGVNVAVVMDTNGHPHRVVPHATLTKAPPDRPAASCTPAWTAHTFHEPTTPAERQRNIELSLADAYQPPPHGSRTVVMRGTQIMGLIPVPRLFEHPGPATTLLERITTPLARLIMKMRH